MARPKKGPGEEEAAARMESALLELIREESLERISVSQITSRAGCSRGAFYYHYTDIYDLFDRMVDRRIPVEVAGIAIAAAVSSGGDKDLLRNAFEDVVDRLSSTRSEDIRLLCQVLDSKAGDRLAKRVKAVAFSVWSEALSPSGGPLESDVRIVVEFAMNGMLGVLAHLAHSEAEFDVRSVAEILGPEIPQAIAACLAKTQQANR